MRFITLPDEKQEQHPYLTWIVMYGFDIVVKSLFKIEAIYPIDYKVEPGTLLISNHQRDSDVPVLTVPFVLRKGTRTHFPLPFYATREDLFYPGFLEKLLLEAGWNRKISKFLGKIPLNWLFFLSRTRPIRRIPEFTLKEMLQEIIQFYPSTSLTVDLLNARGQREIIEAIGYLPKYLGNLMSLPLHECGYRFWGIRRFKVNVLRKIHFNFIQKTISQLNVFKELLNQGRIVYISPEGTISRNGKMGRIRDGAVQLCRQCRNPPPIQPIVLAYDTLKPGIRKRVVVHIGQAIRSYDPHTSNFKHNMQHILIKLHCVTPSHLLACYLKNGPKNFRTPDLLVWLKDTLVVLTEESIPLDPLFQQKPIELWLPERLAWLQGRQIIKASKNQSWINMFEGHSSSGWKSPLEMIEYFSNSFESIIETEQNIKNKLKL